MPQIFGVPWDLVAILLVLAIVVPWRGAVRVKALLARGELHSGERVSIYSTTIAFQWVLTGLTVWRCVAHSWHLDELGVAFSNPIHTTFIGLFMVSLLGLVQFVAFRQLSRMPPEQRGRLGAIAQKLMPQNLVEAMAFLALVCTVSVCEELLYRGFVFTLAQRAFGGSLMAAVVGSSLIFGIGHYYQGRRGVINTSVLGAIFAGLRVWTGSLAPAVMGHFAVDLLAGFGSSRWASSSGSHEEASVAEENSRPNHLE